MLPYDVHIEGRQLEILPEWREKIEGELARLQEHYHDPILHARVEVMGTAHHHLGAFEVRLIAGVAGETITVAKKGEFVLPLLVESFDALDRRLLDHHNKLQQKVKVHDEHAQTGTVARVFPAEDFGFIEADGLEVYFHANALKKGKINDLAPGKRVAFGQEPGDRGPQATWVEPLD